MVRQSETSLQMAIKNALQFLARRTLVHHQWAHQEFSPVRLSACKASILLRKTARAVVRRARRTLFAPRFRSRSIVAPAHKPATIFSDQSPRDEHERLREVRSPSRREWCNKKAATFVAAFSGAPSGTLPRAKERRTVAFLTALRAAALFEYP